MGVVGRAREEGGAPALCVLVCGGRVHPRGLHWQLAPSQLQLTGQSRASW